MTSEDNTFNRRQFARWPVSIPCVLYWEGRKAEAEISDLSFEGALLQTEGLPPEGTRVAINFQFKGRGIHLLGRVTSEVIHSEARASSPTCGVRFDAPMEKYWNQLRPVIEALKEDSTVDPAESG